MLGQRLRRWPNIAPTLGQHLVFTGNVHSVADAVIGGILPASRGRAQRCGSWIAVFVLPGKISVFRLGGDWMRFRPQGPRNAHFILMTVRQMSSACDRIDEMLLILINLMSI